MHRLRVLIGAACACSLPALAQESQPSDFSRIWGGLDIGYAYLSRTYSATDRTTDGSATVAIRGGFAVDPRLLLGAEFAAWSIQSSDLSEPTRGEVISTRFLIAQYYPLASSTLFVRGGGGRVEYWNNRQAESGASGTGGIAGVGYDVPVNGRLAGGVRTYFTSSLDYSWGRFSGATSPPGVVQDQRYQAVSIRFGLTLR
jgi:hypothetical protein